MAKDYFQGINSGHEGERGIRNVQMPQRQRSHNAMNDMRPHGGTPDDTARVTPKRERGSRFWLWGLSGISVLALAFLLLLFVFRSTTVTVVPQSQDITFDDSSQFSAYPSSAAPTGTISYTLESTDIQDSEVVPSKGTRHVETKASGSVTVVNAYASTPVKLIKNTRFQSENGLIFRVPADVSVPGKKGSVAGKVNVTIVADQPGAQYNLGPQDKFVLPGLKSSPTEYANLYAYSVASTTGGFSGQQPDVAPSDRDIAIAKIKTRLQEKATTFKNSQDTDTHRTLGMTVAFTDMPSTTEAGNTVRLHRSAHVEVAIVSNNTFSSALAQSVAANASEGSVDLIPADDFVVSIKDGATWGSDPLSFAVMGHATVVWTIDTKALADALAGRDSGAFQSIVSNFPGVESAHARIDPFWENTFPAKASDIEIRVEKAGSAQ